MAVTKYTDNASAFGRDFGNVPLFQVQLVHECRPSVLQNIIAGMQQFLKDTSAIDENFPHTLTELREQGIIITITGPEDALSVGFQQWRIAMYTDKDIVNLLSFIHDYVVYKVKADKKMKNPILHISGLADFQNPHVWSLQMEAQNVVPYSPFAAQPPNGTKVVLASFEIDETNTVCGMLFGATYAFKDRLEAHGMFGTSFSIAGKNEYVRLFGEVNTEDEAKVAWLIAGLTRVIENTVVQLRVSTKPDPESHEAVVACLDKLREIPTIFVIY